MKAEYAILREERAERETDRTHHPGRGPGQPARPELTAPPAPVPSFLGVRTLASYPLHRTGRADRLDSVLPDLGAGGTLSRRFSVIPPSGKTARSLFDDARRLLDRIVREKILTARARFAFYPAASRGDDILLYRDENRKEVLTTVHSLRQQSQKSGDRPNIAMADFVAPVESGVRDYIGMFAVTSGHGLEPLVAEFMAGHDDYNAILAKALADRLAEAFAERLHERVRQEFWGYAPAEKLDNDALIHEKYQGVRPAPGYPACPDHTEKQTIFELLQAESEIGIKLTESIAMWPGASVSGYYFWRPESQYFGVGKLGRDQVEDYALRKDLPLSEVERWLSPNLGYSR